VGIAPTAQQAIFDSFAQADISIARRYGGTGLGLSITRQLVEVMGGSIDLDSTPGVGSTFTVNLPVSVTRQDVRDADRHQAQRFAGVRVLVAEDNAVNRQVAEGMLKRFGCHCRCVADGRQALQALARERFDMVLMDCQMPVLDGLAATRLLRSEAGGGHRLPVVAMTAHVLPEDRERCRLAGMDDYLPKPVTFDALHTLLQRWFGAGESKNENG
jgi:CheY-like chemotaxis protein